MTQESPSSTARVCSKVGSLPAVSGSVIENAERRSPASSGCSHCCFWSSVPASASTSELPESGAALPNANGANGLEPRISCIRPSLTWPKPWPPSSGGRCAAHRPRSRTCSCSGATARTKPSWPSSSNTVSIGQTSSRTRSRIQSSCAWNSGSVEKSHAIPRSWQGKTGTDVFTVLLAAACVFVVLGTVLQAATGFGFSLVAAPLVFAALEPEPAVGLLLVLGLEVNLLTLTTEGRRPRPLRRSSLTMLAFAVPGALAGVAVLRSLPAVALQV